MDQILIIEPDKPLAKTYALALKKAGHKVTVASNSQAAINKADKAKPRAVVLELQLVGHSGVEFLYEFRSYPDWQDVPVLIHTTVPYMELKDSWGLLSEHLGVSGYKYKPMTSLEDLVKTVNQLVSSR
ncbi:MAG: response regulator [Candidatus Saccharibacteria bacterium]